VERVHKKHLVVCNFIQENSILLLWKGKWTYAPLQETWLTLSPMLNDSISLKEALAMNDIFVLLHLPVSEEAKVQLTLFQTLL
jgi:hypothetical protein